MASLAHNSHYMLIIYDIIVVYITGSLIFSTLQPLVTVRLCSAAASAMLRHCSAVATVCSAVTILVHIQLEVRFVGLAGVFKPP